MARGADAAGGERGSPSPGETSEGESLAAFVRSRRRAAKLTQDALAARAGVGARLVWDLEHGKTSVQLDTADAVLRALGARLAVVPAEPSAHDAAWDEDDDGPYGCPDSRRADEAAEAAAARAAGTERP